MLLVTVRNYEVCGVATTSSGKMFIPIFAKIELPDQQVIAIIVAAAEITAVVWWWLWR
jgi:hypothetical protein